MDPMTMFSLASFMSKALPKDQSYALNMSPWWNLGGSALPSLMSMPTPAKGILGGGLSMLPDITGYNDYSDPLSKRSPLNLISPPMFLASLFR